MRSPCMLFLLLLGCDALFVSNPRNCIENPRACAADQVCNQQTQSCEARSCRSAASECAADQYCEPSSKLCVALDCVASPSQCAADQRCNQSTRRCQTIPFVLGQPDLQTNLNAAYGMNSPQGVLLIPDAQNPGQSKLVVADRGNRRVLIWNSVPSQNRPADAVLGMPDVHTLSPSDAYGGINEASLLAPTTLSAIGSKLAVADPQANRMLFWNQIPTSQPNKGPISANAVWGQTSFRSTQIDSPNGQTNRLGVFGPATSFHATSGRYFVPDSLNHRVLLFFNPPTSPTAAPYGVLGQVDFLNSLFGVSASALNQPRHAAASLNELFVADTLNHRIVVFDVTSPTMNNAPAFAVLGQASLTEGLINRGAAMPTASTLFQPVAVHASEGAARLLWVADALNHRVLRYTLPTPCSSNLAADLVLGQVDFTQRTQPLGASINATTLNTPSGVHSDGTRLVVSDSGTHRVLIWNSLPTANQQPADVVLGQANATASRANNVLPPQPLQFNQVSHVATDGTRLLVCDAGNHRVLLWNQIPKQGPVPPDVVLGQPDFTSGQANRGSSSPTNASLDTPTAVAIYQGRIAVADRGNNRVLVWSSIPTQNGAPAAACLGQFSCSARLDSEGQSRMSAPSGVSLSAGRLFVSDAGNHRVLWFPQNATTGSLAEGLVGQRAFGTKGPNNGGQSAATLSSPRQLLATPTQLLVADSGNHRVLLWRAWPSANGTPADVVIGQEDFASSYTRTSRSRLENPADLLLWNGALYVASADQHRVLIWSQLPTQNGQPADAVIGQPDFASSLPNHPEQPLYSRLSAPVGLAAVGNQLFIAESINNRVLVHDPQP